MTLEETLTRSLHDHLDPLATPRVDLTAVRRAGERRRAARTAAGLVGALALVVGGVALATGVDDGDQVVRPAGLPAMDFDEGLRAFYDDGAGQLHIGGRAFPLSRAAELDLTAAATPHGAIYFTPEQEARLVAEDGSIRSLVPAPEDPGPFDPRVKYDAVEPLAAWLTREGSDVVLTVYRFGDDEGVVGTTTVPCEGRACGGQQVAGIDSGKVFVRDPDQGTRVWDVADLDAPPAWLSSFTVADVRNRVVLGEGTCCGDQPLGPEEWRFVQAEGVESLLTFDGAHELYWSSVLRPTTDGGEPLRLDVPRHDGVEFVALDSDGSVMVAVMSPRSTVYYDCETTSGACEEIERLGPGSGDPVFLGGDM